MEKLSREWTPDEAAEETKASDESLPEAGITQRRPGRSNRAAGGSDHVIGEERYERDDSPLFERPIPPDPPLHHQPTEGR